MSVIVHRCSHCGCCDMAHSDSQPECSERWCKCRHRRADVVAGNPSQVIPTYDVVTGEPIPEVRIAPGGLWGGGNRASGRITCACDSCASLYASLGGVA